MQHYLCYPIPLLKAVEEPLHSASAFPNFQTESRRAECFYPTEESPLRTGVYVRAVTVLTGPATRATSEHTSAHPYPIGSMPGMLFLIHAHRRDDSSSPSQPVSFFFFFASSSNFEIKLSPPFTTEKIGKANLLTYSYFCSVER